MTKQKISLIQYVHSVHLKNPLRKSVKRLLVCVLFSVSLIYKYWIYVIDDIIELKYGGNLECWMRGKIGSHDIFACTAKKKKMQTNWVIKREEKSRRKKYCSWNQIELFTQIVYILSKFHVNNVNIAFFFCNLMLKTMAISCSAYNCQKRQPKKSEKPSGKPISFHRWAN